ncbi:hypothetical protein lerEdw1_012638 [Lerista edwardsae]|nr:hypothetical protein lerEdw1_012638 [Lerista edwardsae]
MAGIVLALWAPCCLAAHDGDGDDSEARERSLHPPYFNLAETARIWATATCGQDESGRPRLELYCKLVGGPRCFARGTNHSGNAGLRGEGKSRVKGTGGTRVDCSDGNDPDRSADLLQS